MDNPAVEACSLKSALRLQATPSPNQSVARMIDLIQSPTQPAMANCRYLLPRAQFGARHEMEAPRGQCLHLTPKSHRGNRCHRTCEKPLHYGSVPVRL